MCWAAHGEQLQKGDLLNRPFLILSRQDVLEEHRLGMEGWVAKGFGTMKSINQRLLSPEVMHVLSCVSA